MLWYIMVKCLNEWYFEGYCPLSVPKIMQICFIFFKHVLFDMSVNCFDEILWLACESLSRADSDGLMCCHGDADVMSFPSSPRTLQLYLFIYFCLVRRVEASVLNAALLSPHIQWQLKDFYNLLFYADRSKV